LTNDCRDKIKSPSTTFINNFPEKEEKSKFIHCNNLPRTMNTTMMETRAASQSHAE